LIQAWVKIDKDIPVEITALFGCAVLAEAYGFARRGARIVTVKLPNPAETLEIQALSLTALFDSLADGTAIRHIVLP